MYASVFSCESYWNLICTLCVYKYIYVHACVYTYMCTHMYAYTHVYRIHTHAMCVYTHIYIFMFFQATKVCHCTDSDKQYQQLCSPDWFTGLQPSLGSHLGMGEGILLLVQATASSLYVFTEVSLLGGSNGADPPPRWSRIPPLLSHPPTWAVRLLSLYESVSILPVSSVC